MFLLIFPFESTGPIFTHVCRLAVEQKPGFSVLSRYIYSLKKYLVHSINNKSVRSVYLTRTARARLANQKTGQKTGSVEKRPKKIYVSPFQVKDFNFSLLFQFIELKRRKMWSDDRRLHTLTRMHARTHARTQKYQTWIPIKQKAFFFLYNFNFIVYWSIEIVPFVSSS